MQIAGTRLGAAQHPHSIRFAYVGTPDALHVYRVTNRGWVKQQTLTTTRPVALTIANHHLYLANEVAQYRNLPCGSVEAYAIDPSTGRLQRKSHVPLSLSAIMPRSLAVSPDGRSLLVAAHGGGAYNVLPVKEDGSLGKVSAILKSVGAGPHPQQAAAHPAAVVFDSTGCALAADQGSDTLHALSLHNGALSFAGRHKVAPGSGPSALVLHPKGGRLYVANAFMGTLSTFNYDTTGAFALQHTAPAESIASVGSLAIHPAGHILYGAMENGIQLWKLTQHGACAFQIKKIGMQADKLLMSAQGDTLFALSGDTVFSLSIEPASGVLQDPVEVASIDQPLSLAVSS